MEHRTFFSRCLVNSRSGEFTLTRKGESREYTRLKEIETEKARMRILAGKNNASLKSLNDPVKNSSQGILEESKDLRDLRNGKSREIAGKNFGVSKEQQNIINDKE